MSGRKRKTERKKAKAKPGKTEPQVFFEDALLAFLREVGKGVGKDKERGGGALSLGSAAVSVCATEALDLARRETGVQGYISAAVYSVVAAMLQGGLWGLPLRPAPEQPPKSPEKPSEPSEEAAK